MSPFQALYGRTPPPLLRYCQHSTSVDSLDNLLLLRDVVLNELKFNLIKAQALSIECNEQLMLIVVTSSFLLATRFFSNFSRIVNILSLNTIVTSWLLVFMVRFRWWARLVFLHIGLTFLPLARFILYFMFHNWMAAEKDKMVGITPENHMMNLLSFEAFDDLISLEEVHLVLKGQ